MVVVVVMMMMMMVMMMMMRAPPAARESSYLMQPIRSKRCEGGSSMIERALGDCTGVRVVESNVLVVAHVGVGSARFDGHDTHLTFVFSGKGRGEGGNIRLGGRVHRHKRNGQQCRQTADVDYAAAAALAHGGHEHTNHFVHGRDVNLQKFQKGEGRKSARSAH